jgi:hypothetical protein
MDGTMVIRVHNASTAHSHFRQRRLLRLMTRDDDTIVSAMTTVSSEWVTSSLFFGRSASCLTRRATAWRNAARLLFLDQGSHNVGRVLDLLTARRSSHSSVVQVFPMTIDSNWESDRNSGTNVNFEASVILYNYAIAIDGLVHWLGTHPTTAPISKARPIKCANALAYCFPKPSTSTTFKAIVLDFCA